MGNTNRTSLDNLPPLSISKYEKGTDYYVRFSRLRIHNIILKMKNHKDLSVEVSFDPTAMHLGTMEISLFDIKTFCVKDRLIIINFVNQQKRSIISTMQLHCDNVGDLEHDIVEACDILLMYIQKN